MPAKKSKKSTKRRKSTSSFSKIDLLRAFLGLFFVLLGFFLLYKIPTIPQKKTNNEPIKASKTFNQGKETSNVKRILISSVDIDLPVEPAKIVDGYWETSDTTASHGEGSLNPGQGGNVVIFAHARMGLFYPLKDVKKGDIVYVLTTNKWYRYKISSVSSVLPNDVTVVAPTKKEVLTLFTCSGFFDEKRLIVKATPLI
ncbi:MAG TPA: sortase [Patescibacteria group bacterium]|nr:sortase [Patescibacteria group bacterium]